MTPVNNQTALADRIKQWRLDGNYWVEDIFGENIKLSNQQREAFVEIGKLCQAKLKHSVGQELTTVEKRYARYIGVNIPSGMGSGKDFFASLLLYYWLMVWPVEKGQPPHGLATANTRTQLSRVLWRQASVIPAMSKPVDPNKPNGKKVLEELFEYQAEKIFRKEYGGQSYYFEAVTVSPHATAEEQAKAITGRHAPYMLMILDEAAGLPEPVFSNIENTLTGRLNIALLIYNPIKSRGYVIDAEKSASWLTLRWNTEDTFFDDIELDNPIKARNADILERFGRDSNAYRIKVMGRPPLADTEVFIPWSWVIDAVNREIEPKDDDLVVMGIDVGAGGDNSAIAVRKGRSVIAIKRKNTPSKTDLLDWATDLILEYKPDGICVDAIGIGWGFSDDLKKISGYKNKVYPIDVKRTSRQRDKYATIRDEMWGTIKDWFDEGTISIPKDEELINQFGSILIKDYDKRGGAIMPKKKELRRKESVGKSPDDAEAICLSTVISDNIIRKNSYHDEDYEIEKRRRREGVRKAVSSVTGY